MNYFEQGESQLFQNLEILLLDNNLFKSVDVFASLAALKKFSCFVNVINLNNLNINIELLKKSIN